MENKSQETTESSSSFDDVSGLESSSAFSDDEFVADFRDDATSSGIRQVFRTRKKPLTSHWRIHIRSLMWRCKWVELQMRQLNRLEHKYTRELAKYNQNELQKVEDMGPDLCSREVSFSGFHRQDKVLKRKRRKRIEDTEDIGTYMSKHNLFSLYFTDNKKIPANGISSHVACGNIGSRLQMLLMVLSAGFDFDDEFRPDEVLLFLETRDGDENMEQVLSKILTLTDHVSKLKIRLDKLMRDIAGKFSYADPKSSLLPCNALTISSRDPSPPLNNRDRMAVGASHNASRLISKHNMGDVLLPESATMSLEESEDDILIYNDRILDGMNGFEDFNVQPAERHQRAAKKTQGTAAPRVSEEPEMLTDEPPARKIHSIAQLTATGSRKSQRQPKLRRRF